MGPFTCLESVGTGCLGWLQEFPGGPKEWQGERLMKKHVLWLSVKQGRGRTRIIWVWWYMPVILALRGRRWEDLMFKTIYSETLSQKKKKKKKKTR
jgi:hypothetical protein